MVYALVPALLIGYLLGSVNTSIIIGKIKGVDIRKSGSKNAGMTNALRVMGEKAAVLVAIGDLLKTFAALFLARIIAKQFFEENGELVLFCEYIAALGAVLGHNFPLYFGFRGGKGVLSSLAVILFLDYRIGLIVAAISIIIIVLTRYVSLGSMMGAIVYPIFVVAFSTDLKSRTVHYYIALSIAISLLALYRHRTNISRLLNGTESKLGKKSDD